VKHEVAQLSDLPSGGVKIVSIEGRAIGVINTGDEVVAVLNVCPHQMAPVCEGTVTGTMLPSSPGELEYGMHNRVLRCPWHGWEFDLGTGRALFRYDKGHLLKFPVTVDGGTVFVDVKERRGSSDEAVIE
jgi:nitrite reductase/ring-hydroxylating ferredoxin subunit